MLESIGSLIHSQNPIADSIFTHDFSLILLNHMGFIANVAIAYVNVIRQMLKNQNTWI